MQLSEYIIATRETWNTEPEEKYQLTNAVLGLSEINEVILKLGYHLEEGTDESKQAILDELGDLQYYWARCIELFEFGIDFEPQLLEHQENIIIQTTIVGVFTLQEIVKKITFHNKDENWIESKYPLIVECLNMIYTFSSELVVEILEKTLEEVWDYNILKLQNRHPNGFSGNYNSEDEIMIVA